MSTVRLSTRKHLVTEKNNWYVFKNIYPIEEFFTLETWWSVCPSVNTGHLWGLEVNRVNKKAIRKTNLLRKFTMKSKVKVKYFLIYQAFPFTSLWGSQRKAEVNSWNSFANCLVEPWGWEVSEGPIRQSLRKPASPIWEVRQLRPHLLYELASK